jgi:hypothetical protein
VGDPRTEEVNTGVSRRAAGTMLAERRSRKEPSNGASADPG